MNTLDAYYGIQQKEHTFFFDNDIVENLILRRQQNLTETMKSKCPKVADRWLSLRNVCKWFCKHKSEISHTKGVNIAFVASQGRTTLVGEQQKSLDKLKSNLLEILGGHQVSLEEPDEENNFIKAGFVVTKENVIVMIKDLGLYYEHLFDKATPAVKKEVWRDISNFELIRMITDHP